MGETAHSMIGRVSLTLLGAIALVALIAGGTYIFSGAYRTGIRTSLVEQSKAKWITGAEALKSTPEELVAKYGYKIIHQSWKSHRVPVGQLETNFVSWSKFHPDALHILWADDDNREFMRRFYPEFEATFWSKMLTGVQR